MQTEPEQWAVDAWERYGPMIFNCEITGPEALRLVVEEQTRKLREECQHDPIEKGDWCLRGFCRKCGHDTLKETPNAQ